VHGYRFFSAGIAGAANSRQRFWQIAMLAAAGSLVAVPQADRAAQVGGEPLPAEREVADGVPPAAGAEVGRVGEGQVERALDRPLEGLVELAELHRATVDLDGLSIKAKRRNLA